MRNYRRRSQIKGNPCDECQSLNGISCSRVIQLFHLIRSLTILRSIIGKIKRIRILTKNYTIRIFPRKKKVTTIQSRLRERRSINKIRKSHRVRQISSQVHRWLTKGQHQNSGSTENSRRNFTRHRTRQW